MLIVAIHDIVYNRNFYTLLWTGQGLIYSWNFQGIDVIQVSRIDPDQLVSALKAIKYKVFTPRELIIF